MSHYRYDSLIFLIRKRLEEEGKIGKEKTNLPFASDIFWHWGDAIWTLLCTKFCWNIKDHIASYHQEYTFVYWLYNFLIGRFLKPSESLKYVLTKIRDAQMKLSGVRIILRLVGKRSLFDPIGLDIRWGTCWLFGSRKVQQVALYP